jgi:tetratricopeptide (TPR) repeat protein
VLRVVDKTGGHVGRVPLNIDHFGYERDQERKYARDLPLLLQRVRTDPDSVYCWQQIGHIHRMQGDIAAARAALGSGIEVVRAKPSLVHQDSLPFVELAAIGLETGDPPPGPLLSEARELFPDQFHLAWFEGRRLLQQQRFSAAAEQFTALAAREDDDLTDHALGYDVRLFGAWPLAGLASCRFAEARYAEAATLFAAAARRDPEQLEYRVKQALAARLAGAANVT